MGWGTTVFRGSVGPVKGKAVGRTATMGTAGASMGAGQMT